MTRNTQGRMRFSAWRNAAVLAAPLLLSLSEVTRAADLATEDGVLVLTGDTIEQAIKDHSHLVVEFYAPCKYAWYLVYTAASVHAYLTCCACSLGIAGSDVPIRDDSSLINPRCTSS